MSFKIGDRVRWTETRDGGWMGDGRGEIVAYAPERPFFAGGRPATKKQPPAGPAVCVKFDHKGLTEWLPPAELMPDLEALAAS